MIAVSTTAIHAHYEGKEPVVGLSLNQNHAPASQPREAVEIQSGLPYYLHLSYTQYHLDTVE